MTGAQPHRVIAIDGPAGSGKSTVARQLASRLRLDYLDTGAMYRSVAFAALQRDIRPEDGDAVAALAHEIAIEVGDVVLVDGHDATLEIRGPEVTHAVSTVAANPEVRADLRERQRVWAQQHGGGVIEGRDIGTVVFPDATLKVYLTASDSERARRRHEEVAARSDGAPAVETVQADIARRDHMDSTRAASPLAVADDAVIIDTTGLSVDAIVEDLLGRLGQPAERPPASAAHPEEGRVAVATRSATLDAHGAWRPTERTRIGHQFDLLLYGFCRLVVIGFSRVFWRLHVEGTENLPTSGPYVIAAVHRSNIDTPLVACITSRRMRFMGKDSLWKNRASARFLSALGGFPVHRGSADRDAMRRCTEVIAEGEPLVLFPEGTRQSGPLIEEIFDGAAYMATRAGVPIVPVGIGGSERAMPVGAKGLRPGRIAIVVGKPIEPQPVADGRRGSRRAVKELTESLHTELQTLFDAARLKAEA